VIFGHFGRFGLQRLGADRRAGVLPIFALGATALMASGAIGVDLSRAYAIQNSLQTAADAAAMAAAHDLRDQHLALQSAKRMLEAHLPLAEHGQVLADTDFVVGNWDSDTKVFTAGTSSPNALQLTVRRAAASGNPVELNFARVVGFSSMDLQASATATVSSSLPLCLLSLNPTVKNAIEAAGSSQAVAEDCVVYANSSSPTDAIHARSAASITAGAVCAVGGARGSISPSPETGCPPLADPLASLPTPNRWPAHKCDDSGGSFGPGTVIISPGIYCAGIDVESSTTLHMEPGVYMLIDAPFRATSGARVVGHGVHIHLRGAGGQIDLSGTPELDLSAPTSGDYAGVVLHADRSQAGLTHFITGNVDMAIDGTMYAPTGRVEFTGNSRAAITMLIADTIKFNGHSRLRRNAHLTSVPIPSGFSGLGASTRTVLVR